MIFNKVVRVQAGPGAEGYVEALRVGHGQRFEL